jgi:dCTP deaminase
VTIKSDRWITRMARDHGMITPFVAEQIKAATSYGVGSYGYDMRVAGEWLLPARFARARVAAYTLRHGRPPVYEIKGEMPIPFRQVIAPSIVLWPGQFLLCRSVETFDIPPDVQAIVHGKSSLARAGIHILVTPLEPGWRGEVTIEIVNHFWLPVRLYAGEGIGQVVFHQSDEPCAISYKDKAGKYQDQRGVVPSRA